MPLFYNQTRPLSAQLHGALRLGTGSRLKFAAATNSIPIAADEFFVAQAHYPIVFAGGPQPGPLIVVGMQNGRNLFVTEAGAWRPDAYVPAYVRRYPFALAQIEGRSDVIMAIDESADLFSQTDGAPLFENGQPTAVVQRAQQFCVTFQRHFDNAQRFAAAAAAANLLVDKQIEVRSRNRATPFVFSGFKIIDEARFNDMPDPVHLEWRRNGWSALVYAHLMSLQRWRTLAALAGAQGTWDELLTNEQTEPAAAATKAG